MIVLEKQTKGALTGQTFSALDPSGDDERNRARAGRDCSVWSLLRNLTERTAREKPESRYRTSHLVPMKELQASSN